MKNKEEVINIIEPVLLTKLHMINLSKQPLSSLLPCLGLIASSYNLNLSNGSDFRVCVKILEDSVIKN
jgi:hypothetical protein